MTFKDNHQLRERVIEQAMVFGASSAGIARPAELVSFPALLGADRGVIKL